MKQRRELASKHGIDAELPKDELLKKLIAKLCPSSSGGGSKTGSKAASKSSSKKVAKAGNKPAADDDEDEDEDDDDAAPPPVEAGGGKKVSKAANVQKPAPVAPAAAAPSEGMARLAALEAKIPILEGQVKALEDKLARVGAVLIGGSPTAAAQAAPEDVLAKFKQPDGSGKFTDAQLARFATLRNYTYKGTGLRERRLEAAELCKVKAPAAEDEDEEDEEDYRVGLKDGDPRVLVNPDGSKITNNRYYSATSKEWNVGEDVHARRKVTDPWGVWELVRQVPASEKPAKGAGLEVTRDGKTFITYEANDDTYGGARTEPDDDEEVDEDEDD